MLVCGAGSIHKFLPEIIKDGKLNSATSSAAMTPAPGRINDSHAIAAATKAPKIDVIHWMPIHIVSFSLICSHI